MIEYSHRSHAQEYWFSCVSDMVSWWRSCVGYTLSRIWQIEDKVLPDLVPRAHCLRQSGARIMRHKCTKGKIWTKRLMPTIIYSSVIWRVIVRFYRKCQCDFNTMSWK